MNLDDELLKAGYELAEGCHRDDRIFQLWINEATGQAVRIEWFSWER